MPVIDADGCPIHVEVEGPERAPVLMLCNSLGTDLHMWGPQVAPFTKQYRLVRYDRRGHGKSGAPQGPYSMDRLGRDVLAILDGLGLDKVNWCGLSMGGMVGMWLGAHAPERIERLILSNTSCYYADKTLWDMRIAAVRSDGLEPLADRILTLWFSQEFRERAPAAAARMKTMLTATPVQGYIGCCAAVRDMDHRDILQKIAAPTLIIAGRHDPATNLEAAEFMRERIAGAALSVLDAAHISNIERPEEFSAQVLQFLARA